MGKEVDQETVRSREVVAEPRSRLWKDGVWNGAQGLGYGALGSIACLYLLQRVGTRGKLTFSFFPIVSLYL